MHYPNLRETPTMLHKSINQRCHCGLIGLILMYPNYHIRPKILFLTARFVDDVDNFCNSAAAKRSGKAG